ncbi:Transcriptional regulator, AcrR family [Olavius algarvensis associated proteobacterium Delta 3]|nr:Transcriptional regulator, AcrR family [Olavius algarvensis associated proteobacterium Delta 3]
MGIQERKEKEKERRRQQIMVAAKRVFTEKGFSRATMEDIAREAELSPGTLYLYFKNKDELYASLSLRVLQYLLIRLEHVSEDTRAPSERLELLSEALFDVYEFDPLTVINMFHLQSSETLNNLSEEFLAEIMDLSRKALSMIARIFKEGIDAGAFIEAHPVAMADIFWSMFSGIVLWEESKRFIDDRKDYLKETLDLAMRIFRQGISAGN